MNILELGCGDGALWTQNLSKLPGNIHITLSDISEGMLRDARRAIGGEDPRFLSKLLTVTTFLQGLAPLIWSLPIMYFFTVTTLERCAKMYKNPEARRTFSLQYLRFQTYAGGQPSSPVLR